MNNDTEKLTRAVNSAAAAMWAIAGILLAMVILNA